MDQPPRKALVIGLHLGNAASLAYALSAAGHNVWLASGDAEELACVRLDDHVFVHRLFANRIASIHEVFESIDQRPGALEFVLFEAGHSELEQEAASDITGSIKTALISVITQSIRRMAPLKRGWIYVHDDRSGRKPSWLSALFSKGQTLQNMVEGAAAEVKAVGVRVEYISTADILSEIEYSPELAEAGVITDGFDELPGRNILQLPN